jgi:hypothetical protein
LRTTRTAPATRPTARCRGPDGGPWGDRESFGEQVLELSQRRVHFLTNQRAGGERLDEDRARRLRFARHRLHQIADRGAQAAQGVVAEVAAVADLPDQAADRHADDRREAPFDAAEVLVEGAGRDAGAVDQRPDRDRVVTGFGGQTGKGGAKPQTLVGGDGFSRETGTRFEPFEDRLLSRWSRAGDPARTRH